MRTLPKHKLIPALLVVAALLALPAAANATLTYTKGFNKPHVYIAGDNGKGARQIGPGSDSHISPDGEWIAYERATRNGAELRLYSVAVGKSERVLGSWVDSSVFAWSPDSSTFAALTGPLNGPQTLVLINAENLRRVKIAQGYVNGVSFSPEGTKVAYGLAKTESFPARSDIYTASVEGGTPDALTTTHDAIDPLWGPTGQIVFARQLNAANRKYGEPEDQLFVMNEEGQRISQLSHTKVPPLTLGLAPVGWSADGTRLLTEFGGQDTSYAVALNAVTGAEKALTKNTETGFAGAAISADGTTVLGTTGLGFGPSHPSVATVPFSGGPQKVLVRGGYEPSWNK